MKRRPTDTIPHNFLGLNEKYSDYNAARFAVLPVPYDAAASFLPGARHAPAAIINASYHLEWFDEELEVEAYDCGVATLDALEPSLDGPEAMHERIFKHARRVVRDGKIPIGLGGDHSVTAGLVRAVMTKHKKLSVLQIDAHLDLRDRFLGSRFAHACVMRRCLEMGATIVPVGIRAVSPSEHRFVKRHPIEPITARDCHMEDEWIDRVLNGLGEKVYVTMDIDAFDPSFAPGTGTPEPGGLDWYQVTGLLRLVAAEKRIVGADIVEVLPIPGQVVTEFLAARLAYKLMAYIQHEA
ncbi:MAG: agmatinase [Phycisphaerae bacterium]